MPKILLSSARVRSIIADAVTHYDVVDALRRHRIRYSYSTDGGVLHVRIPCRTGCIRIYAADTVPAAIMAHSGPFTAPVYRKDFQ